MWATHTVGTFVGAAQGSSGDVASWGARIEHPVQTQPTGRITGGWATLYTSDRGHLGEVGQQLIVRDSSRATRP